MQKLQIENKKKKLLIKNNKLTMYINIEIFIIYITAMQNLNKKKP